MTDQLARHAAEIALRLAALPAEGFSGDMQALDNVEQLAIEILQEVSAARKAKGRLPGETRGAWPAMQVEIASSRRR
jgi:hypothetical protein